MLVSSGDARSFRPMMKAKMKAARLYAPGDLRYEEVDIPDVMEDEVLVRVKAVGVCGSDPPRVMLKGTYTYPTIVGHEFSGEVAERLCVRLQIVSMGVRISPSPLSHSTAHSWFELPEVCAGKFRHTSRRNHLLSASTIKRESVETRPG